MEVISWVEENIYYFVNKMLLKLMNDDTISMVRVIYHLYILMKYEN